MKIRLLRASKKFLPEILAINNAVQGNPWSLEDLGRELDHSQGLQYVAVNLSGEINGYLFARLTAETAEILVIGISNNAMRQGIGKTLVNELITQCRSSGQDEVILEVSHKNLQALEFYKALGFQIYLVRREYYRDGTDALCMKLKLANPQ